jgi:3-Ketosteroid 9alpha-hydroxylase C-terminal domain
MTPTCTPDDSTGERSLASAQATVTLFAQDIPIWENKGYRPTPLFCDGDKVASQYRRWVRRFYPDADVRLSGTPART